MVPPPGGNDAAAPIARRRPLAGLTVTAEDDPRQRKTYAQVRQSLAASGINNVPIFHTAEGAVIDGNTRLCAMLDLGMAECVAIELPPDWSEAKILSFSIATDGVRRTLPPEELAAKAERYMDLTGSTQEAAAREFGISPAHLSRALTSVLLPARFAEAARSLKASVRSFLAAIKDPAVQEAAMSYATTAGPDGRLPTRAMIEAWVKRREKRPGRPPRSSVEVKLGSAGPILGMTIRADTEPKAWIREMKSLVALAETNAAYGMDALVAILKGRRPPEPASASPAA